MRIDLLARRWGGPQGGRDGMSIAVSYCAWTLAEMGHAVRCFICRGLAHPWEHRNASWVELPPQSVPSSWDADLIITTIHPSWRGAAIAAQKAGAIGRLMYWHHHGPIPPGHGCMLARVAPGSPAKGWARELVLPPATWALYAGGQRTGDSVVVPGLNRGKGGDISLAVAQRVTDRPWYVLPGRANQRGLGEWRALPHVTVALPGLPPKIWLDRAGVVLSPTRAETYGLAMAEAAARGIPVVTTELPGPRFALQGLATMLPMRAGVRQWEEALRGAVDTTPPRLQPEPYSIVIQKALGPLLRGGAERVVQQTTPPTPPRRPSMAPRPQRRARAERPAPQPVRPAAVQVVPQPGERLHIGCGPKHLRGWLNTDAKPGVGPDGVLDLAHLDSLPPGRCSAIYACHVLEHCYYLETPGILKSLLRALEPGGELLLAVPDVRLAVQWIESGRGDPNNPIMGNLRRGCADWDRHKQVFWQERSLKLLADAGFVDVGLWSPDEYPEIAAVKDWSYHPEITLNVRGRRVGQRPKRDPSGRLLRHPDGVDVSVLLGTVDREGMLRECVDSIRASLEGSGYTHEIVVAYGTEEEPVLPWMRAQPDILPVLGGLTGAIDAYNLAYRSARRGRYVCQLNDDVVVEGPSLANAIRRLDADPGLGVVAFLSSLNGGQTRYRPTHPSGTIHPNQLVARREALEDVIASGYGAFWGDEAARTHKTYGGDTVLGLWLARLGWRVERPDDVLCLDRCRTPEARDDLRRANRDGFSRHRVEQRERYLETDFGAPIVRAPDSWPHIYVPEPGRLPRRSPAVAGPPERVLHLSLVHGASASHPGLEHALAELGPYRRVQWADLMKRQGKQAMREGVLAAIREHQPTLIWMQIQQSSPFDELAYLQAMRRAAPPGCLLVSWTGDVRTDLGEPCQRWQIAQCAGVDLFLASNCTYPVDLRKRHGVPAKTGYMLCAADEEQNRPRPDTDPGQWAGAGQAVFVGGDHRCYGTSSRLRILEAVHRALPGQLAIYGSGRWGDLPAHPAITRDERSYLHSVAGVVISHSLFTRLRRYTSGRLPDALLCGSCVATQDFDDLEGLGLRHGENALVYRDSADLVELLRDWLRPERAEDRRRMGEAARAHALQHLTWHAAIEGMAAIVRAERRRRSLR